MCLQPAPISVSVAQQRAGKRCFGLQVSKQLPTMLSHTDIIVAGISIGVGLLRIAFPESKQFLEAKKAGKRNTSAVEFWKETRSMLAKEWRLCVYCVILMTWVSPKPRPIPIPCNAV
jgi:hypothetical protein